MKGGEYSPPNHQNGEHAEPAASVFNEGRGIFPAKLRLGQGCNGVPDSSMKGGEYSPPNRVPLALAPHRVESSMKGGEYSPSNFRSIEAVPWAESLQ